MVARRQLKPANPASKAFIPTSQNTFLATRRTVESWAHSGYAQGHQVRELRDLLQAILDDGRLSS